MGVPSPSSGSLRITRGLPSGCRAHTRKPPLWRPSQQVGHLGPVAQRDTVAAGGPRLRAGPGRLARAPRRGRLAVGAREDLFGFGRSGGLGPIPQRRSPAARRAPSRMPPAGHPPGSSLPGPSRRCAGRTGRFRSSPRAQHRRDDRGEDAEPRRHGLEKIDGLRLRRRRRSRSGPLGPGLAGRSAGVVGSVAVAARLVARVVPRGLPQHLLRDCPRTCPISLALTSPSTPRPN